jgi:hypothetical protein
VPPPTPTPTPGPLDIIRTFDAALVRGDTDAALDLFVDEGLGFDVKGFYAGDQDELRRVLDVWAGIDVSEGGIRDCQSKDSRLTCTWYLRDICTRSHGLDAIHIPITFMFQDQKIRFVSGQSAGEEAVADEEGKRKVRAWAAANRPEEYQMYTDPASGLTAREWGELVAGLCRDYVEATSQ